jgi:hypothetical protein
MLTYAFTKIILVEFIVLLYCAQLLFYIRGAWWASTWILVTIALVVFDLTSTSIVLADIAYEVNIDQNC